MITGTVRHARVTTGAVGALGSISVTVPWANAFTDTNYTVVASVLDSTALTASLSVVHVESLQVNSVNVRINNTSNVPITGTVHVIGIHD